MNFTYNYNHYHLHQHSIIQVGVMQKTSNLTYTKVKKITFLQRFMYILFWASLLCIFHNFDALPTSKMSSNPWLLAFLQKFKKIGNVKKAACTDKKCCFWFFGFNAGNFPTNVLFHGGLMYIIHLQHSWLWPFQSPILVGLKKLLAKFSTQASV